MKKCFAICLLVFLAGCQKETFHTQDKEDLTLRSGGSGAVLVEKVNVDGTDCIVMVGYKHAALSCNWSKTE